MIPEFELRDRHCYMDNAATTVIDQSVVEAMVPYLEERYGNPETVYDIGLEAGGAVEKARAQIAEVLGCRSDRLFFTSGGTEANNWAIKGFVMPEGKSCIAVGQVEHSSVLEPVRSLARRFPDNYTYSLIDVDSFGRVEMVQLESEIANGDVGLVSIQFGNNEVGTLQPVREIAKLCHDNGAFFHCDACQAFGKLPFDVEEYDFDFLSVSAHKIHGPMGVGALYVKEGVSLEPLLDGGGQEAGMRSGTLPVASIVGFGVAAEMTLHDAKAMGRVSRFVDSIAASLESSCGATRNGDPKNRLPHILSMTFPELPGASLVGVLAKKGVCVSMGSACRTRKRKSHVLEAMGIGYKENNRTIRISPSRYTDDVDTVLLIQAIQQARKNPEMLEYL